jgi:hypothetical protein
VKAYVSVIGGGGSISVNSVAAQRIWRQHGCENSMAASMTAANGVTGNRRKAW